nr:radical SAM protein [Dissulfurirhabdus thermomarina]
MWSPSAQAAFNGLCPPLGLGYLAASLLEAGATVEIVDLAVAPEPRAALARALERTRPRLVGITSISQNYDLALEAARAARALAPEALVVMGGPHASYCWREVLSNREVDVVVCFEGERTIVELLRAVDAGRRGAAAALAETAGIAWRDGEAAVQTPARPPETDLDRLPHPARHLLPMARYGRPGNIMTSRGCPMKCIFCISSTYEGNYRPRGAEDVLAELEELRFVWGLRDLYFIDNVFTVDADRVRAICRGIVEAELEIRFDCVSRANLVTEELVGWLRAAGCQRVEIGVESGSQEVIEQLRKGITLDQVRRAAEITLGQGLTPMFTFQVGAPFDTPETLEATHRLAAELRAKGAVTFFSIMTPFPGTPLALEAEALGVRIHARAWRDYRTSNPISETRCLSRNDLRRALYRETLAQLQEGIAPGMGLS